MTQFVVKGSLKNYDGEKLLIQVFDDDLRLNDDLLASVFVKSDGTFETSFSDDLSKEFLERNPDIFLVIRNKNGKIIHKTETRSEVSPTDLKKLEFYDLTITKNISTPKDPYENNFRRSLGSFQQIADTINPTENTQRTMNFLLQTLQAWTIYTDERVWKKIRYDGPQVDRYPWRTTHPHNLGWEK